MQIGRATLTACLMLGHTVLPAYGRVDQHSLKAAQNRFYCGNRGPKKVSLEDCPDPEGLDKVCACSAGRESAQAAATPQLHSITDDHGGADQP